MSSAPQTPILLVDSDGTEISVPTRHSRRATRMLLRVDPARGGPELVLPDGVAADRAADFARRHIGWLRARLDRLPSRVAFADGAVIPVLGIDHRIRHRPDQRGGVWRADAATEGPEMQGPEQRGPELHVAGDPAHLPRRLTDWLKAEAKREIAPRARDHAAILERRLGRVSVRDTRSRWGSCSARGDLSFSWRLILAPEPVLDYVVAHEAAHLVEMNHSVRFWRLVERLMPDYERWRTWLKHHGARLHAYD